MWDDYPAGDAEGAVDAEEEEDDVSYWLSNPPEGFGSQLSQFGRLFTTLDGWVTDATLRFVRRPPGGRAGQPEDIPPPEFAQVGQNVCRIFSVSIFRMAQGHFTARARATGACIPQGVHDISFVHALLLCPHMVIDTSTAVFLTLLLSRRRRASVLFGMAQLAVFMLP